LKIKLKHWRSFPGKNASNTAPNGVLRFLAGWVAWAKAPRCPRGPHEEAAVRDTAGTGCVDALRGATLQSSARSQKALTV